MKINPPKTPTLLAIDQAANQSGWAFFENKVPTKYGVINPVPAKCKGGQRLNSIRTQFEDLIKELKPSMIVIEEPFGDDSDERGKLTARVLSEVKGVLSELAYSLGVELKVLPAASWVFITGIHKRDRDSRKEGARLFCENTYSITNQEQDVYDAICIGHSLIHWDDNRYLRIDGNIYKTEGAW